MNLDTTLNNATEAQSKTAVARMVLACVMVMAVGVIVLADLAAQPGRQHEVAAAHAASSAATAAQQAAPDEEVQPTFALY